jgi:hypothetical protein
MEKKRYWELKEEALVASSGVHPLEEAMNLFQSRLRNELRFGS